MVDRRTVWAVVLGALALGCGSAPARPVQPTSWKDYQLTTPLPAFAQELGQPCAANWGGSPLYVMCGRGRRAAIASFRDHEAVTGRWRPTCGSFCHEPERKQSAEPPRSFAFPPLLAAKSDGKHAYTEFWLYIDGPWLWLRAEAIASQFGGAALTIVDRRLLSEENERWLANSLHLADPAGIYDDQRLIRSVQQYREP